MSIKTSRLILKSTIFTASLIPIGWLAFALWSDTIKATSFMTVDPVQKLNRELGDWALIFIIITLTLRPLAEVLKISEFISYRRMMGLYAFLYAVLHFASYMVLDLQFDLAELFQDIIKRNFILVGMLAIMLLVPLALTSSKVMIKRIGGRRWKKIHYLVYPIAILSSLHFFMMIRADFSRPIIYAGIIIILLAYRLFKHLDKASPKDV